MQEPELDFPEPNPLFYHFALCRTFCLLTREGASSNISKVRKHISLVVLVNNKALRLAEKRREAGHTAASECLQAPACEQQPASKA
jgi:hypothetical protein